jgi:hypothetical protein
MVFPRLEACAPDLATVGARWKEASDPSWWIIAAMRRLALLIALAATLIEGCTARRSAVCHPCFWEYQPAGFEQELVEVYGERHYDDPFVDAQRRLLLSVVNQSHGDLCDARASIVALESSATMADPARALLASEIAAFTADTCGADPAAAFRVASARARGASWSWKARVYAELAENTFQPSFGDTAIAKKLEVPPGATSFVLGASRIVVSSGTRVGAQVERTVRDWLSYQLAWDESDTPVGGSELLTWHEGARLRDLLDAAPAKVFPLTGALAVKHGDRWLAPDGNGVFKYEILEDKIQYPTTLVWHDVALIVDTHGLSAMVEPARRAGVSLVVGCGDYPDKMAAAFDLARAGVNAWFPCDRFAGDILGYDAPGVLIGSAPVRREGDHAVIGGRPIRFSMDETFVAQDFEGRGPLRYYDAPARYFRALSAVLPIKVNYVAVDDAGQSSRVVKRAEELGANAVGVRVQTDEDAAPVRAWLEASPRHRAVLLHTAPYPAGYALFEDFPAQTTFADPRPTFQEGTATETP